MCAGLHVYAIVNSILALPIALTMFDKCIIRTLFAHRLTDKGTVQHCADVQGILGIHRPHTIEAAFLSLEDLNESIMIHELLVPSKSLQG